MNTEDKAEMPSQVDENDELKSVGLRLDERYLSSGHWHALRPKEINALRDYLFSGGVDNGDSQGVVKALIGLALATGKTIDEVLLLPINSTPLNSDGTVCTDSLIISRHIRGWIKAHNFWQIALPNGQTLLLPLYRFVSLTLGWFVNSTTIGLLRDSLPLSAEPWDRKTKRKLAELLCTTERIATIRVRDALPRVIYKISGNKALVFWFCAARTAQTLKVGNQMISLQYYLEPGSTKSVELYAEACELIFGRVLKGHLAVGKYHAVVPLGDLSNFALWLQAEIRKCHDSSEIIAVHNAFALYTLTLLIVATAHRESRTPFYFTWDFRISDGVAFISDKQAPGSEARFVPLVEQVQKQVHAYWRHLLSLRKALKESHPEVCAHIENLLAVGIKSYRDQTGSQNALAETYSQFFSIKPDGTIKSMGTSAINHAIKRAGYTFRVGRLRKTLANYLYEFGLDGYRLEAFLGHSNELHPFGSASSWDSLGFASAVTPLIDEYLKSAGWQALESPLLSKVESKVVPMPRVPGFMPGYASYEGRQGERHLAMARARKAAIQVLSEEALTDPEYKVDDSQIKLIKARIKEVMGSDEEGARKINHVLDNELDSLRSRGVNVKTSIFNRIRNEPSPIGISFSRHAAIGDVIREAWIARVGSPIAANMDRTERIAQLVISLVIFDAVLDQTKLRSIVEEIDSSHMSHDGGLVVRSIVRTPRFEFNFMCVPGFISGASLVGLAGDGDGPVNEDAQWKDVEAAISQILTKLIGRQAGHGKWTIRHLLEVFRAWWFVRLPGALYSITAGENNGPAPHPNSMQAMLSTIVAEHGVAPPETPIEVSDSDEAAPNLSPAKAKKVFVSFLSAIAGSVEKGTANERSRRMRLRSAKETLDAELQYWCEMQPIVNLMVSFVFRLADQGGSRKKRLKVSTIYTYPSKILSAVLEHGWNHDPEDWGESEYIEFYGKIRRQLEKNDPQWMLPLRYFHQHLREMVGAPYISSMASPVMVKQRCRTSILTHKQFQESYSTLSTLKGRNARYGREASSLLCLGYGYGTRRNEAIAIATTHFVGGGKCMPVELVQNRIRGLKSNNSRRLIQGGFVATMLLKPLREQVNFAKQAPQEVPYLFGSPDRTNKVTSRALLFAPVIGAIRMSSGNPDIVYQDLRRTMATRMMLAAFPPACPIAIVKKAREAILGDVSSDEMPGIMELTQTSEHSPFVVDGIARALGHVGVDTLLDVYFVGSAFLLAEHTQKVNSGVAIDDTRLGALLRKDRSAIAHLRRKLKQKQNGQAVGINEIVEFYIRQYGKNISPATSPGNKAGEDARGAGDHVTNNTADCNGALPIQWIQFDRLLIERKNNRLPMDSLRDLAVGPEYGLDAGQIDNFFEAYRGLVTEIGFDDFEPDRSDLIMQRPARSGGVRRGSMEREATLSLAQRLHDGNKLFRSQLARVCGAWRARLNTVDPWFIACDLAELDTILQLLKKLGALDEQIEVRWAGMNSDHVVRDLLRRYPAAAQHTGRLSRGNPRARVTEIGVRVKQTAGSKIGDGRDLHRAFAVMSCAINPEAEGAGAARP